MAALTCVYSPSDLSTSIVDGDTPLAALYENNKGGNRKCQCKQNKNHDYMQLTRPGKFQGTPNCRRQSRHNTCKNYDRYAVSYTAFTYLLTEPHEEYRACDQGSNDSDAKTPAWLDNHRQCTSLLCFQGNCHPKRLKHRKSHSPVSRIPCYLPAPRFSLFPKLLQPGVNMRKELHDNGGRNVRHDSDCENRETLQRPSREHIEHVKDGTPLLIEQNLECNWINSRYWNERTNPKDDKRAKYEQQALFEFDRRTATRWRAGLQLPFRHLQSILNPSARGLN